VDALASPAVSEPSTVVQSTSRIRWSWPAAARIAASHVIACLVAGTFMVTLPLAAFTLLYIGGLTYAAVTNGDIGGPLFYPLGALLIGAVGFTCFLAVFAFGFATDMLRRLLGMSRWLTLFAAWALAFLASLSISVATHSGVLRAFAIATALAPAGVAAFATYWVPLNVCDLALSWIARVVSRRVPTSWAWRKMRTSA
jgi:hypothetical protein